LAGLDPEQRPHVVAEFREVGHEGNRVVAHVGLDLEAFAVEQDPADELEHDVADRFVRPEAEQDLVRQRAATVVTGAMKRELRGQAGRR
jgi:hypothetical protein